MFLRPANTKQLQSFLTRNAFLLKAQSVLSPEIRPKGLGTFKIHPYGVILLIIINHPHSLCNSVLTLSQKLLLNNTTQALWYEIVCETSYFKSQTIERIFQEMLLRLNSFQKYQLQSILINLLQFYPSLPPLYLLFHSKLLKYLSGYFCVLFDLVESSQSLTSAKFRRDLAPL